MRCILEFKNRPFITADAPELTITLNSVFWLCSN